MLNSVNQLRDFSSLFSRSTVQQWFKDDFKSIDIKLERYNLYKKNKGKSYLKVVKDAYRLLEKLYPNEYVVKNEFLNKWIKHEICDNNAVVFNEFRLGNAVADLAVFNGVSRVFEIKTALDTDYRLSSQLREYKKLFNEVYIVIPKLQLSKYQSSDEQVGIITFEAQTGLFELEKKSHTFEKIDKSVLMNILHTKEYLNIVKTQCKSIPDMNTFSQFEICRDQISKISDAELNQLFIDTMKKRKIHNVFFNKINREFNQVCLSLNLDRNKRDNLITKLISNKVE